MVGICSLLYMPGTINSYFPKFLFNTPQRLCRDGLLNW